jgi:protein-tyrosine phosphatase
MNFLTEKLAIGDQLDVTKQKIRSCQIGAILNCAVELDDKIPTKVDYLKIPLDDGVPIEQEHIEKAVAWVKKRWNEGKTVLIHCGAGVSRSVAMVICCLIAEGYTLDEALELIRKKRGCAIPHPAIMKSVIEYYKRLRKDEPKKSSMTKEEFDAWNKRSTEALFRDFGDVLEFMGSPEFHDGKMKYDDPEKEKTAREREAERQRVRALDEEFDELQRRLHAPNLSEDEFKDIVVKLGAHGVRRNRAQFDALM